MNSQSIWQDGTFQKTSSRILLCVAGRRSADCHTHHSADGGWLLFCSSSIQKRNSPASRMKFWTACTRTRCRVIYLRKLCSFLFPFWELPFLFSATIVAMKRTQKNNKAVSGGPLPRGFTQIGAMTWQGNPVELWLQKKTGELAFVMNGTPVEDEKTIDALQDYLQKANRPEE